MGATREERIRIASELRKAERYMGAYAFGQHIARAVDPEDETETWDAVCSRLADLIKPDEAQFRDAAKTVDVGALLELADEMDARAVELLKLNDLDQSRQRRSARQAHAMDLMAACSRIREACGESS